MVNTNGKYNTDSMTVLDFVIWAVKHNALDCYMRVRTGNYDDPAEQTDVSEDLLRIYEDELWID